MDAKGNPFLVALCKSEASSFSCCENIVFSQCLQDMAVPAICSCRVDVGTPNLFANGHTEASFLYSYIAFLNCLHPTGVLYQL
jgi:hypothetical protein